MTAVHSNNLENAKILLKYGAKIDCDTVRGIDLIATAMSFNNVGRNIIFKFNIISTVVFFSNK